MEEKRGTISVYGELERARRDVPGEAESRGWVRTDCVVQTTPQHPSLGVDECAEQDD